VDAILDAAVAYGSFSHLEHVLTIFPTRLLRHCLPSAIRCQQFEMIKWIADTHNLSQIYGNGNNYINFGLMHHNQVFQEALETGNENIITYIAPFYIAGMLCLTEFGCGDYFIAAAKSGQMKWVHWLLHRNCPKHINTIREAAISRNLEMVMELRELNFPWSAATFSAACAIPNNERVLQYLRDHYCPVNEWAYGAMILPEILATTGEWLLAQQFPLTSNVMIYACQFRNRKAILWLVKHSCPVPSDIIRRLLTFDDTTILDLIDQKYQPTTKMSDVYDDAIKAGQSKS